MPAASLRALLAHAIDYAGLFPPASLTLAPALENQAAYVRSPDRWMLGAFILPVAQFAEAGAILDRFDQANPLQVSALGAKAENAAAFQPAVESAAATIRQFSARHRASAPVVQFEMPVPPDLDCNSLGDATALLGGLGLEIFWEAPADAAGSTIAALKGSGAGFKLRTGGVTADAFPSGAQIARALVAAARHQVAIKFTAGLHHPVKRFHKSVGTKMHGFLNVLGAGVLAAEHGWSDAQTEEMLAEEDPGAFACDDASLRWRDWEITTEQIARRRRLVTSLGSCSFDEPREDLRALGIF